MICNRENGTTVIDTAFPAGLAQDCTSLVARPAPGPLSLLLFLDLSKKVFFGLSGALRHYEQTQTNERASFL